MNVYPALKLEFGTWTYYVVKMSTRELVENVHYAADIHDDKTLADAIQRTLVESRVKKDIVRYLQRTPERFFSSIVIAALGGEPTFFPIEIAAQPQFEMLSSDKRMADSFGVLRFDGSQMYYALDGQHRLKAIETLIDKATAESDDAPQGFEGEELSVIVVVPEIEENNQVFFQKYRRLFSNLNRYAKPTDLTTNIIMDEDDAFAIITRWLITDHPFFQHPGNQKDSARIKTKGGKNLNSRDNFFTSLQTLYHMNRILLHSSDRENHGWARCSTDDVAKDEVKEFIKYRPDEDVLVALYEELKIYWNGLISVLPDLENSPSKMRVHPIAGEGENKEEDSDGCDHLLFWPIGQEYILAEVARSLLDRNLSEAEVYHPTHQGAVQALAPLGTIDWRLTSAPWKHLLLIQTEDDKWRMRNEERKEALRASVRLLRYMTGLDELDEDGELELFTFWKALLIRPPEEKTAVEEMWAIVASDPDET